MQRTEHVIESVFAYRFTAPEPDHALLICHGMGGHGGIYDPFCSAYATTRRGDVWSIDLPGFGRSTSAGRRGEFTAERWVDATTSCAAHIRKQTGLPVVVKIDRLVDFDIDYGFVGAAREKHLDPLNTWEMDLGSFASIFTYQPANDWRTNTKPILFTVGEHDPLSPHERIQFVAHHRPCPTEVYVHPKGVHQLMLFHTADYCAVVRDFVDRSIQTHQETP